MTLVTIYCPYEDCKAETSIIIEAIDKQTYACRNCNRKSTVESEIIIREYGDDR